MPKKFLIQGSASLGYRICQVVGDSWIPITRNYDNYGEAFKVLEQIRLDNTAPNFGD